MRVLQVGWESGLISSLYEKERVKRMGWAFLVWNWWGTPPHTEILINYLILMNWPNGTIWLVVGLPISFSTVSWCHWSEVLFNYTIKQFICCCNFWFLVFLQFEVEDFIKQSYHTVCDYEQLNYSIQVQGTFPWDAQKTLLWLETHARDWTLCIKHQKLSVASLLLNPINLHHVAKNWHLTAKKKSKTSSLLELAIGSIDRIQCCLELQLTQKKKKGKNPGSGRNKQTYHTLTVGKLVGTPIERNSISNLEKISCRSTGRSAASKDQLHQKCAQKCAKLLDKASWI
jgi:hypothetical protein